MRKIELYVSSEEYELNHAQWIAIDDVFVYSRWVGDKIWHTSVSKESTEEKLPGIIFKGG